MDRFGILALLEAKPGKEREVADFLKSARSLVLQEVGTSTWFAFQTGPASFGIFDTFADEDGRKAHLAGEVARLCCISSVGRSWLLRSGSSGDSEDIEQLVDEAHLVLHVRLAHEAMTAADHPHHLKAFDRSRRRLHCLKASRGANDSLQCTVVRFNEVVQILARAMLGIA